MSIIVSFLTSNSEMQICIENLIILCNFPQNLLCISYFFAVSAFCLFLLYFCLSAPLMDNLSLFYIYIRNFILTFKIDKLEEQNYDCLENIVIVEFSQFNLLKYSLFLFPFLCKMFDTNAIEKELRMRECSGVYDHKILDPTVRNVFLLTEEVK